METFMTSSTLHIALIMLGSMMAPVVAQNDDSASRFHFANPKEILEKLDKTFHYHNEALCPFGFSLRKQKVIVEVAQPKADTNNSPRTSLDKIIQKIPINGVIGSKRSFLSNGRMIRENQTVSIKYKDRLYKIRAISITSAAITFQDTDSQESAVRQLRLKPIKRTIPASSPKGKLGSYIKRESDPIVIAPETIKISR